MCGRQSDELSELIDQIEGRNLCRLELIDYLTLGLDRNLVLLIELTRGFGPADMDSVSELAPYCGAPSTGKHCCAEVDERRGLGEFLDDVLSPGLRACRIFSMA